MRNISNVYLTIIIVHAYLASLVSELLLGSVVEVFGLEENLNPEETKLQLWGAGVPLNTWGEEGYLYDAENNVGCVGDWLTEPSVAGAWESGRRLALFMDSGDIDTKNSVGIETGEWKYNDNVNDNGLGDV